MPKMKRRTFASTLIALAWLAAPGLASDLASDLASGAQAAETTPGAPGKPAQKTIEEITVYGEKEKIVRDFVGSYAAPVPSLIGQIARWNVEICPVTVGLSAGFNTFVTSRVKEVAALVGAPVEAAGDAKTPCKTNIQIIFTPYPQGLMDAVRKKASWLLGFHYFAQAKGLATFSYPIQSWYATATADSNGTLTADDLGFGNCGSWGLADACSATVKGRRLGKGFRSEFMVVSVVVDMTKIGDLEIGPIADYIAMLALAQTKSFDECRELASVANLLAPGCAADKKANALTVTDIAYLRALYQMNMDAPGGLQTIELARWMMRNLEESQAEGAPK